MPRTGWWCNSIATSFSWRAFVSSNSSINPHIDIHSAYNDRQTGEEESTDEKERKKKKHWRACDDYREHTKIGSSFIAHRIYHSFIHNMFHLTFTFSKNCETSYFDAWDRARVCVLYLRWCQVMLIIFAHSILFIFVSAYISLLACGTAYKKQS